MNATRIRPLSVDVWESLKFLLEKSKNPYLSREKFVLQRDAFVRLVDEDIASDVPFVSYEYNEIKTDESLDFSLRMFRDYFVLSVGPTTFTNTYYGFSFDSTEVLKMDEYDLLTADPKVCAKNLLLTIKLILSGQLAIGCNWKHGGLLAAETFLTGYETKPIPLAIIGGFSTFNRSALDYTVKQNRLIDPVKIPDSFPLLPPLVNGVRVGRGRRVESIHDLEPLTKKMYDQLCNEYSLHELAGKRPDENIWSYFYKTIEFWAVAIVTVALVIFVRASPHSPKIFHSDWSQPVFVFATWFIVPFVSGILLTWRQRKIDAGGNPLSSRLERVLGRIGIVRTALFLASIAGAVTILFAPMWTLKHGTELVTGASLLSIIPALALPLGLSVLLAALLALFHRPDSLLYRLALAVCGVGYTVSAFVINGMYMNTGDSAPDPQMVMFTIFVVAAIGLPIATVSWFVAGLRSKRNS